MHEDLIVPFRFANSASNSAASIEEMQSVLSDKVTELSILYLESV